MSRGAVPRQLGYEAALPLAINSRSQRRSFFPDNGATFTSGNNTQIHMRLNADAFLDSAHSYLKFKVDLSGGDIAAGTFDPDVGVPWINRIRISSGGQVIEDVEDWNKLYAFLLLNQSGSDYSIKNGKASGFNMSSLDATALPGAAAAGSVLKYGDAATGVVGFDGANKQTFEYCLPLMTGFFNLDKYLPLLFINGGIDVDIYLEDPHVCGNFSAGTTAGKEQLPDLKYVVTNVEYMATLINLDADFNMRLKSIIDSAGMLQLSGTTFRHIQNAVTPASDMTITCPIRVKSIKSIFTLFEPTDGGRATKTGRYILSNSQRCGITQWQFRIGSVVYPAKPVEVNSASPSFAQESHCELMKAFGTLGNYDHQISYGAGNYVADDDVVVAPAAVVPCFAIGYDFESFQKATNAIESGINTADRSLPIVLECKSASTAALTGANAHTYVMADAIWYINSAGTVTVSV